jgi:hypothetical protein
MVVLYSDLLQSSKNIMNSIGLLLILAFYVLILFYIAHWAEKRVILNGQLIRISIRFP